MKISNMFAFIFISSGILHVVLLGVSFSNKRFAKVVRHEIDTFLLFTIIHTA